MRKEAILLILSGLATAVVAKEEPPKNASHISVDEKASNSSDLKVEAQSDSPTILYHPNGSPAVRNVGPYAPTHLRYIPGYMHPHGYVVLNPQQLLQKPPVGNPGGQPRYIFFQQPDHSSEKANGNELVYEVPLSNSRPGSRGLKPELQPGIPPGGPALYPRPSPPVTGGYPGPPPSRLNSYPPQGHLPGGGLYPARPVPGLNRYVGPLTPGYSRYRGPPAPPPLSSRYPRPPPSNSIRNPDIPSGPPPPPPPPGHSYYPESRPVTPYTNPDLPPSYRSKPPTYHTGTSRPESHQKDLHPPRENQYSEEYPRPISSGPRQTHYSGSPPPPPPPPPSFRDTRAPVPPRPPSHFKMEDGRSLEDLPRNKERYTDPGIVRKPSLEPPGGSYNSHESSEEYDNHYARNNYNTVRPPPRPSYPDVPPSKLYPPLPPPRHSYHNSGENSAEDHSEEYSKPPKIHGAHRSPNPPPHRSVHPLPPPPPPRSVYPPPPRNVHPLPPPPPSRIVHPLPPPPPSRIVHPLPPPRSVPPPPPYGHVSSHSTSSYGPGYSSHSSSPASGSYYHSQSNSDSDSDSDSNEGHKYHPHTSSEENYNSHPPSHHSNALPYSRPSDKPRSTTSYTERKPGGPPSSQVPVYKPPIRGRYKPTGPPPALKHHSEIPGLQYTPEHPSLQSAHHSESLPPRLPPDHSGERYEHPIPPRPYDGPPQSRPHIYRDEGPSHSFPLPPPQGHPPQPTLRNPGRPYSSPDHYPPDDYNSVSHHRDESSSHEEDYPPSPYIPHEPIAPPSPRIPTEPRKPKPPRTPYSEGNSRQKLPAKSHRHIDDEEDNSEEQPSGSTAAIPGEPGKDYPILSARPSTNFNCHNKPPGYYADIQHRCQVYYLCGPQGHLQSFLCPNGTIFNQATFVCEWWYNVDCDDSEKHYARNNDLYKVPDPEEKNAKKNHPGQRHSAQTQPHRLRPSFPPASHQEEEQRDYFPPGQHIRNNQESSAEYRSREPPHYAPSHQHLLPQARHPPEHSHPVAPLPPPPPTQRYPLSSPPPPPQRHIPPSDAPHRHPLPPSDPSSHRHPLPPLERPSQRHPLPPHSDREPGDYRGDYSHPDESRYRSSEDDDDTHYQEESFQSFRTTKFDSKKTPKDQTEKKKD